MNASKLQLHCIELPTPFPVGPVNTYLLLGDPLTLVDVGPKTDEARSALEAGLAAAGVRLDQIRRIILTHGHTDHFGMTEVIRAASGAEVFAHEGERAKLTGKRWIATHLKRFFVQAGVPKSFQAEFLRSVQAYRTYFDPLTMFSPVKDGEALVIDGTRLRVLHCPGHSVGHICIYHEDGILLAGDVLLPEVSPNPVVEFTPKGQRIPTLPQYLQSLRRILLLNCNLAYPGHGSPIASPNARVRELIAHHEQRKEEIRARLNRKPKTLLALTQEIYQNLDPFNTLLALSEVIGHLDLLAEEHRVGVSRSGSRLLYRPK